MTPISATGGILTVTDLNDFNDPAQTTNLDLFGRATSYKTTNTYFRASVC